MSNAEIELAHIDIQKEFAEGLSRIGDAIKDPGDAGKFLLLLANSYLDSQRSTALLDKLHATCGLLSGKTRAMLAAGKPSGMKPDDLLVFLQADAIGINSLKPFARKRVGPWDVQFNHVRFLRPRRAASGVGSGTIHLEFNDRGFHFNKPFLKDECFLRCTHQGAVVHLFYNKFPFHKGHVLVVLAPEANHEQYLTEPRLRQGWSIAETLDARHGMRLGYNSLGAYASVNHLHYQAILGSLPVEATLWQHNGGREKYPASCEVFTDPRSTWEWIADRHNESDAYNLLISGARAYCFARRHQADFTHSEWTSGFAWYELSGSLIVSNTDDYQSVDQGAIEEEMRMTTSR